MKKRSLKFTLCKKWELKKGIETPKKGYLYESIKGVTKLVGDRIELQIIQLPNEPGVGLGFGIVGGASTGVVVKTVLPGSPADKSKELKPGDHILKVGAVNVQGMGSQQVATILRQQAGTVELVVGRQPSVKDSSPEAPNRWTMMTRDAMCARVLQEEVDKRMYCMASTSQRAMEANNLNCFIGESYKEDTSNDAKDSVDLRTDASASATDLLNNQVPTSENIDTNASVKKVVAEVQRECSNDTESATDLNKTHIDTQIPSTSSVHSETDNTNKEASEAVEDQVIYNYQQLSDMEGEEAIIFALQALTLFKKEKWPDSKYEVIEVELSRDPVLGLGITLVGYVHSKVEIRGVFVKSVVPNSSASYTKKIKLHDLILEVDGRLLENMNHDEAVRTLMKSGSRVKLKLVRFQAGTPQEQCLKMLQEQETATQVFDMQTTLVDVVADWKRKLGVEFDVISVDLIPDKCEDGGLGITIEGTVDVVDGAQLCPHHYIGSLRPGGPAANSNSLRSGDELLQVAFSNKSNFFANDVVLYGESHVTVRQALSRPANKHQWVRLTVARKAQTVNVFVPQNYEKSLPVAYPLLAASDDRLVKAKSDSCLSMACDSTAALLEQVSERLRSRSLQPFTGLAIWKCVPIVVYLEKDSKGLGFSVVDYRDPVHPGQSVIVIRSLVPGGAAQADGRIVPGDRLMYVNNEDLSNSTLDHAVAVLKAAPQGVVRLGIAKPVPIEQCETTRHSPIFSRGERVIAKGTSPRLRRRHHKDVCHFSPFFYRINLSFVYNYKLCH
uniref:Inactivation-no-after-D protein n=1 Tax=Syphacia muris TaxID=451379 RepID=A0A158R428_9BILA